MHNNSRSLLSLIAVAAAAVASVTAMPAAGRRARAAASSVPVQVQNCPPAFNHVITIVLENEDASSVYADPYLGANLTSRGYSLTNMHGVWHPSQPNYIGMISGQIHFPLVLGDYDINLSGNTIVDLLEAKGLTWKSYQEDYEGVCNTASTMGGAHGYARKHNPFISFKSISENPTRCANIVNSAQLDIDAAAGKLPNYMFYTPNLNNDGHDTNVAYLSNWLQGFLEPKFSDPAYADVLFVITFDESESYLSDNKIYTVLLGKGIAGVGVSDDTQYNHYSVLATIEKNFNLGNLGEGDAAAAVIPLTPVPCIKQNIKNVVVIAFENNSFDRLFGAWARTRKDVDGTPAGASQYCPQIDQTLAVEFNLPLNQSTGADHSIDGTTTEIYGLGVATNNTAGHAPTMTGFCAAEDTTDLKFLHAVLDGFSVDKLPIFTTLAGEYAVFDRWFAGVPGPTIPNRLFLMSATAHNSAGEPVIENSLKDDIAGYPPKSIFRNLDESSISWKNYFSYVPTSIIMKDTRSIFNIPKWQLMKEFFSDAAAGTLPQFSFIDPNYGNGDTTTEIFGQPNDGTPGTDFARAEALVKDIYEALVASPQWKDTLLLVTFDEHGGTYDHVPPPTTGVPSPDPIAANSPLFKFDRLGVRVPTLAISPWIPKGTVIHAPNFPSPDAYFEHSSLSATLKNFFNLPDFLTARDAAAGTFDDYSRILSAPRTDCLTKLPDAPAFSVPDSGIVHDISVGDLPQLIKDVEEFLKNIK